MKSLRLKLSLLFYLAVFIIVTAVFTFTEYVAFNQSNSTATKLLELGPAYINGVSLSELEALAQNKEPYGAIFERLNGLSASSVLENFDPVADFTTPGGLSGNTSITLKPELSRSDNNYYLLEDTSSKIGPLLISDNFFPMTITAFKDGPPWRRLYYSPVAGYEDLVIVASMDIRFIPEGDWFGNVPGDVVLVLPIALVAALLLGSVITRITVSPLVKLTEFSEKLAAGKLDERTKIKSKDEIGRLGESLNYMAGELQGSFEAQARFVSNAAHDMRTPLASMKTAITGELTEINQNEKQRQLLEFLDRRTNTLDHLINDLLVQAKSDETVSGGFENQANVSEVVLKVAKEFEPVFEDKGVELNVRLGTQGRSSDLRGDEMQLSRLFSNLIDNAVKNTPSGGLVAVEVTSDDEHVLVTVRDTGYGIAPEHLEKIFDRFYKVADERSPESGFGLGLSICRGIVNRHGGKITVASTQGKGSVFSVTLPRSNKDQVF